MGLGVRSLGQAGLEVSELGLGCVGMSELYGPREPEESVATIQHALDRGLTLFDTSDAYGVGHNENFVGAAIGARRDEAVIATKFGAIRKPDGGGYYVDGRPDYVTSACNASLDRLGTDHIDLYYQHRMDPDTPIEETVGAMAGLVETGKVRFLGLSECSSEILRRAHEVHPISAVQIEYSLFAREPETGLLAVCRELGVGVVAYSPLGRGILTGSINDLDTLTAEDYRHMDPRYHQDNLARNLGLVSSIDQRAQRLGCTPGQLALAWLLTAGDDIVPIPGTKRRRHLDENLDATEVHLTPEEFQLISDLVSAEMVAGDRYPPAELARLRG
jgi:aryl-alcohol dehydrogenase-like predicted oxidoreductase